ncbi:MAG: imidazole glycerol phosphate synthase subunit HisH [Candidatus Eremiobacterota bacterium]
MKTDKILVIDYNVGNHQSVANALNFLGYDVIVSNKEKEIAEARAYILPGVGAFGEAMRHLHQLKIIEPLQEQVLVKKKPLLGICLGMQVLAEDSEEDTSYKGLGWIEGHIVKFKIKGDLRVPHVGWNSIQILKKDPLFKRIEENINFYFDHSYYFICDASYVTSICFYGTHIVASVQKENIFGIQFHPEKSQNNGLKLLRGFLNYCNNI